MRLRWVFLRCLSFVAIPPARSGLKLTLWPKKEPRVLPLFRMEAGKALGGMLGMTGNTRIQHL